MRDYALEKEKRIAYIANKLKETGAKGIVFGNSGGKDCTLVGILCAAACKNVLSVMMPCESTVNFGSDLSDAQKTVDQFDIENITIDLTSVKRTWKRAAESNDISADAEKNLAPRLRMMTLYALAQSRGYLVAGTGNRSELYMGYFTKWGDGGCDFNPIADLTAGEVFEFLSYLNAPQSIIDKKPSAGLFEGQTDEAEMGVSYDAIDRYIQTGQGNDQDIAIIERAHQITAHKRKMPDRYHE